METRRPGGRDNIGAGLISQTDMAGLKWCVDRVMLCREDRACRVGYVERTGHAGWVM